MKTSGHSNKNSGGQMTSYIRTLYYGPFFADLTQARSNGLPPAVLSREEPMSDKAQALLSNPYFLVSNVDPSWMTG